MSRLLAGLAILVASLVVAQPAAANTSEPTVHPALVHGRFQIVAPQNAWGIRGQARWIDDRVAGLRIFTAGSHPDARIIHVEIGNYGATEWWGLTGYEPDRVVIRLNSYHGTGRYASGHELLHAIGIYEHHNGYGLLGKHEYPNFPRPSWEEIRTLRRTY